MEKQNKFALTRSQYKKIKKFDHSQMQEWVLSLIQGAYEKGRESAEGIGESEMKEVLLSVKGIGEKKAEAIMQAMKEAAEKQ